MNATAFHGDEGHLGAKIRNAVQEHAHILSHLIDPALDPSFRVCRLHVAVVIGEAGDDRLQVRSLMARVNLSITALESFDPSATSRPPFPSSGATRLVGARSTGPPTSPR
jgi:hypothetical protein